MKPLLAATLTDLSAVAYPVIGSPKLDGIRCLIGGGAALSRTFKPIPNLSVRSWAASLAQQFDNLDGELIDGEHDSTVYNRTSSAIMSADGPDTWMYWVFDCFTNPALPYSKRLEQLKLLPANGRIKLIPSKMLRNEAELRQFEKDCLSRGFEGVMIRSVNGQYKYGRSTVNEGILLKLKQFTDSEATVIGWGERMHNENEAKTGLLGQTERSTEKAGMKPAGDLGYLLVRGEDGVTFKIGSGFTAAQRIDFWKNQKSLMNRLVKYKHFEQGAKDAPRFPTFLGFRDRSDT